MEQAINQLLSLPKPIDGLFFASNKLSTFGLKYINALSVRVPQDLFLCSFDQSDATDLFYAPLTHIRQPLTQMGEEAVQMLLEMVGNNNKRNASFLQPFNLRFRTLRWGYNDSINVTVNHYFE